MKAKKAMKIIEKWKKYAAEGSDPDRFFDAASEKRDLPRERAKEEEHTIDRILASRAGHADLKKVRKLYMILAAVSALTLITVLLLTVSGLPRFGEEPGQAHEVADYYIENALEETGAVNIVAGMILDYRAFDTLGESFVLFTALNCVLILLRRDFNDEYPLKNYFDLTHDPILGTVGYFVIPSVMLFGVYVMLNGHLSPGGGFSGGAIAGAGLIFLSVAFGARVSAKIVTEKLFRIVSGVALSFYCLAKSYSFFTGANHLESGIPLGTPGSIFSSGLILPLNIAVGIVVTFTMYGIYRMFRKGSLK
ncbi:MAG: hypothetical protein MJ141_07990 [Clostridia bacterium]|nr:hypothetical protein [Clostridia bacterium]